MPKSWIIRAAVLAAALLALGGCASALRAPPAPPPLADALFAAPAQPPQAAAVMAVSPAMRAYLQQAFGGAAARHATARMLLAALFERGELRLDYDAQHTRNASEAFADRAGNCLSLVLMTAAFAGELGLEVGFNEVLVDEQWRREGDLVLRSGHVNLTLGLLPRRDGWAVSAGSALMVDFLPPEELRGLRTRPIDPARVLAMYFNNRAAEALAGGRTGEAYWLAREALRQDGGFDAARNTLGVVYQRAGQVALAAQVFEELLERQPEDTSALANLAQVRLAQGRPQQAAALQARREALEPFVPGVARDRGIAALRRGDADTALMHFEHEIARGGPAPELQWWLAQAQWRLGQAQAAEQALQQAVAASSLPADRSRYAAKLAWLRAQAAAGAVPARGALH